MATVKISNIRKSRLDIEAGNQDYLVLAGGGVEVGAGNAIWERAGVSFTSFGIDGTVSTDARASFAIFSEGRDGHWVVGAHGRVSGGSGLYFSGDGTDLVNKGDIRASGQSGVWFDSGRHDLGNEGEIVAKAGIALGAQAGFVEVANGGMMSGKVGIYAEDADLTIGNGLNGVIKGSQAGIWSTSQAGAVIDNAGVISSPGWAMLLGSGRDRVINQGTIDGQADLGGGNDVFIQKDGVFQGYLFMGGGHDRFVFEGGDFQSPLPGPTWIRGGKGDDVYDTANLYVLCVEAKNGGHDTQYSALLTMLRDNIEDLVLTGVYNISGEGNGLANALTGNSGRNYLAGHDGNDRIDGGGDDDTLSGDGGKDVFIFRDAFGNDMILDWTNGVDRIDLSGVAGIDSFADLAGAFSDTGTGVLITIGAETINVWGAALADLDASDFIF
jgi:Ca2+-binding RTX toxin-like protein